MSVEVSYDTKDVKKLQKLLRIASSVDPDPPLKRMGVYMISETDRTFREGGRGSVKWSALSDATFSIRESTKGKRGELRPLMGEGHLRRAFNTKIFGPKKERNLKIFTPTPYAKFHQEGARIRIFGRGKLRSLPKRPMLFFTKKDRDRAAQEFKDHANNVMRDAVHKSGLRK